MKTIQIAPYRKDCKIVGNNIIGTMDGRTFVFTLPKNVRMPETKYEQNCIISNFIEAIAICSKPLQVEQLLNDHWQIKGGTFKEI